MRVYCKWGPFKSSIDHAVSGRCPVSRGANCLRAVCASQPSQVCSPPSLILTSIFSDQHTGQIYSSLFDSVRCLSVFPIIFAIQAAHYPMRLYKNKKKRLGCSSAMFILLWMFLSEYKMCRVSTLTWWLLHCSYTLLTCKSKEGAPTVDTVSLGWPRLGIYDGCDSATSRNAVKCCSVSVRWCWGYCSYYSRVKVCR